MAVNLISSNDISITQTGSDIELDFTSNAVANKNIYSTSETRIGTWIDGKPLYRRIISDTLGTTNGSWKGITITTSNYIKKVVSITGMFEYANGNDYSIPFFRGTDDSYSNREFCLCNINPIIGEFAIIARHPSNYALMSGQPLYAIVLYTKSSDY